MKDLSNFSPGYEASGSKRTKVSASDSYTSSGGDAFDLNSPMEESVGTQVPTECRPMGQKAAKRKGKAKATEPPPVA